MSRPVSRIVFTALPATSPARSVAMGQPTVDLNHALRLAHEMEDEEHERELGVGR